MEISLAWLNFLSMQAEGFTDQSDFQASLATRRKVSLFLACFEMSEKLFQQTVAFDTGSSLFLVHCGNPVGGDGEYSLDPPYNSAGSSTFSNLADMNIVTMPLCAFVTKNHANIICNMELDFQEGYLQTAANDYNGLLELGTAKHSLLSQLGSGEFSYCIEKLGDSSYDKNILIVGKNLATGGDSTPFQIAGFKYYADLEGISFGGKMLDNDNEQLKISNHKGGAAFDSGASSSALQPMA
ncbi:uncharacterized protein LOC113774299 [Coffea eugenioides]|uniref:uncharacterized protein LOC113774299 n=1 Tax=Coffea eugenioides TaxID=49369 RepID=UPI000F60FFBE|nr:uncharacterized protein LOC113774299 [Coffea eugenioides]